MRMTIDEIIAKETEIAQEFQKIIDTHMISEDMSLEEAYCGDTELIEEVLKRHKEQFDYYNTIANTMRKYQKIEEIVKNTQQLCSYGSAFIDIRKVLKDDKD